MLRRFRNRVAVPRAFRPQPADIAQGGLAFLLAYVIAYVVQAL